MLRAVTFDCWGTLVDLGHTNAQERIAHLCRLLPDRAQECVAQAYEATWRLFGQVELLGFSLPASTMLSLTLDELGATLQPGQRADVLRYWEEVVTTSPPRLLEGVPEALGDLRARGLRLGLISDTGMTPGRVMRRVLERAGILAHFGHCTFSNELGVTKRRPQAFLATLAALDVSPGEALHVGDQPETDIRGAKAVGMRAALLLQNNPRPEGRALADLVLERIADLPDALDRL
jgi:putative hydrolase of the HAD superfamily